MMRAKKIDEVGGIFWLLVGGAICVASISMGLGSLGEPGPGLIPFFVGSLLGTLSMLLLIQSFFAKAKNQTEDLREVLLGSNWRHIGVVVISLVAYAVFLPFLGFMISTFLLLSFLFNFSRRKGWIVRVIGAGFIAAATFLVFRVWLDCPLPLGIFKITF